MPVEPRLPDRSIRNRDIKMVLSRITPKVYGLPKGFRRKSAEKALETAWKLWDEKGLTLTRAERCDG